MVKQGGMKCVVLFGLVVFLCLSTLAWAEEGFPLRAEYPDLKVISTDELASRYDEIIVVDVRSQEEFDVAHVAKAKHVPIALATFAKDLEGARAKDGAEPMAFYCNGHTCAKSYQAAKKAEEAGFANVLVYDGGIFDWINAQPERATLLGKTPADKSKVIPKEAFTAKLLDYAAFSAKAGEAETLVIDIREPFQRQDKIELAGLRNIPLDRLIPLLEKKEFAGKQLLFLDAVGKQVEWLQYHLKEHGYENFWFLKGGVKEAAK